MSLWHIITHAGVTAKLEPKTKNDLILTNSISLAGFLVVLMLVILSIPQFEWMYVLYASFTSALCLSVIILNKFEFRIASLIVFAGLMPTLMFAFVL